MPHVHEHDAILLVEDTIADQELTLHELRKHGVGNPVTVVESGAAALDYLFGTGRFAGRDANVQPLVMLLDLGLPGIDGANVLRRVRADLRTKGLPVIVLTSSSRETDLMRSYALAAKYAQKPLVFASFQATLKKLGLLARLYTTAVSMAAAAGINPLIG